MHIFARDRAFMDLLKQLPQGLKDNISSLCIGGTSSTALLVDSRRGDILAPTKIYNEDQGADAFEATKVCSDFTSCYNHIFVPSSPRTASSKPISHQLELYWPPAELKQPAAL